MRTKNFLIVLIITCASGTAGAEAVFGRLYTTPNQRAQLDEARNKKPQGEIIIEIAAENLPETEATEDDSASAQSITLDGIVYRSDGKNTAWINRNSTNEGNLENQFTKVGEKDVQSNQVKITLPDNQTTIDLKVGQQYDVNTKEITDTMKNPDTTRPSAQPEERRPSR